MTSQMKKYTRAYYIIVRINNASFNYLTDKASIVLTHHSLKTLLNILSDIFYGYFQEITFIRVLIFDYGNKIVRQCVSTLYPLGFIAKRSRHELQLLACTFV